MHVHNHGRTIEDLFVLAWCKVPTFIQAMYTIQYPLGLLPSRNTRQYSSIPTVIPKRGISYTALLPLHAPEWARPTRWDAGCAEKHVIRTYEYKSPDRRER